MCLKKYTPADAGSNRLFADSLSPLYIFADLRSFLNASDSVSVESSVCLALFINPVPVRKSLVSDAFTSGAFVRPLQSVYGCLCLLDYLSLVVCRKRLIIYNN